MHVATCVEEHQTQVSPGIGVVRSKSYSSSVEILAFPQTLEQNINTMYISK